MKRYIIQGYEKDSDLYEVLEDTNSLYDALNILDYYMQKHNKSEITSAQTNEPFDWFEIYDNIAKTRLAHSNQYENTIVFDNKNKNPV